jgi:hypothetical protein
VEFENRDRLSKEMIPMLGKNHEEEKNDLQKRKRSGDELLAVDSHRDDVITFVHNRFDDAFMTHCLFSLSLPVRSEAARGNARR